MCGKVSVFVNIKRKEIEMRLTKSKLRDLICGATQVVDDGILMILNADDDFRYDVGVLFYLNEESGKLEISGFCSELKVARSNVPDAMLFVNDYNKDKSFLSVNYDGDDQDFNVSWSMMTKGASDECVKSNLDIIISLIWQFFVAVGKEF